MTADLDCGVVAALLPAFADGELDTLQRAAVGAHLAHCPACQALRQHEDAFTALLRARLPGTEAAPASLRAAIGAALSADPRPAFWARSLASPWLPRIAAAAVLALLVVVPLAWLPQRSHGQAQATVEQHRSHAFLPGEPLPPCCTPVAAGVGTALGPPSPGAVVPDLHASGLELTTVVHCTFAPAPVHLLSYRDAAGSVYSLYVTDRAWREFKLLRARSREGVVQVRDEIETAAGSFSVCRYLDGRLVYTWVAPAANATGAAALATLLAAAR
jgi:anti-sigma factor RsiW